MAEVKKVASGAGKYDRVFETPAGQTYLDNLRRLHPSEKTMRAAKEAQKRDKGRAR